MKPLVFYIKVGFKGVYISRTSFPDDMSFVLAITHDKKYNKVPEKRNIAW